MSTIRSEKFVITCKECGCNRVEFTSFHDGCYPEIGEFECPGCHAKERVEC